MFFFFFRSLLVMAEMHGGGKTEEIVNVQNTEDYFQTKT